MEFFLIFDLLIPQPCRLTAVLLEEKTRGMEHQVSFPDSAPSEDECEYPIIPGFVQFDGVIEPVVQPDLPEYLPDLIRHLLSLQRRLSLS